jgi:hypothetical protein
MIKVFELSWCDDTQCQTVEVLSTKANRIARVPKYDNFGTDQIAVSFPTPDGIAVLCGFECKNGSCDARHFLGYAKTEAEAADLATKWVAKHMA